MNLFHLGPKGMEVGMILEPQDHSYSKCIEAKGMEDLLEDFRPKDKISRKEAVFFVRDVEKAYRMGADSDEEIYVACVDAEDAMAQRSDFNWLSCMDIGCHSKADLLAGLTSAERREIEQAAIGYWSGEPMPGKTPSWEFRAEPVEIAIVLKDYKYVIKR